MQIQFTVPDMACGACAATIEQAVRQIDPAAEFTADTATKVIRISTTAASDAIQQAIRVAGYNPT
ncbi:MAG: hypothetical protein RLZZ511_2094 [Cyanobacteriota bacterium]|jgi:copper chaperone